MLSSALMSSSPIRDILIRDMIFEVVRIIYGFSKYQYGVKIIRRRSACQA